MMTTRFISLLFLAASTGCLDTADLGGGSTSEGSSGGISTSGAASSTGSSSGANDSTDQGSSTTGLAESSTGDWPLCEPRAFERFTFQVQGATGWPDGFHNASCSIDTADATGISLRDCIDDTGSAPAASLDLEIDLPDGAVLPVAADDLVEVSYVIARLPKEKAEHWYSLRNASGDLLLAAFSDYDNTVVPIVEETEDPSWLTPFSISRGSFACPVQPGCEQDDNPQRATAIVQYEEETLEPLDGTSVEVGSYRVWIDAGEPDYCEGQPTWWNLHGLILATE
jgi:hypothetical protein